MSGRFAVPHTLAYLAANKLTVGTPVKRVVVSTGKTGAGQAGARKFIYQNFPPLQFHNPSTSFLWKKSNDSSPPSMTIELEGQSPVSIPLAERHSNKVLKEFLQITKGKRETVAAAESQSPASSSSAPAEKPTPASIAAQEELKAATKKAFTLNRLYDNPRPVAAPVDASSSTTPAAPAPAADKKKKQKK